MNQCRVLGEALGAQRDLQRGMPAMANNRAVPIILRLKMISRGVLRMALLYLPSVELAKIFLTPMLAFRMSVLDGQATFLAKQG